MLFRSKTGESINQSVIKKIAKTVSVPIQVGGGIRSLATIEDYIKNGVARVIIGTAAINDRQFLQEAVKKYKEKVAVSLDARNGYIATDGWTDTSNITALDLLKELENIGVQTIVYTDISKDGMLQGPNLAEQKTINEATTIDLIASGGITTKTDVENLQNLNLYGAIIGKALYDGKLDFAEVVGE